MADRIATDQQLIDYMEQATSDEDWKARVDEVKRQNYGNYPRNWLPVMIVTGRYAKIMQKWDPSATDGHHVMPLMPPPK